MIRTDSPPSIAVVMPVYNGEAYLSEAIDSALAQTHRPSEIVILDDASSDATAAIIDRYRAHPLIKTRRLASRVSAPAAWNHAVRLSSADYFVVLAHDDRLHPSFLARMADVLANEPDVALVVSGYDLIDAAGRLLERRPIRQPYLLGRTEFDVFFREMVTHGMYFQPTCAIVARPAFDAVDGFDERFHAVYDYDFYIRLATMAPTYGVGQQLVDYRRHPANLSAEVFHTDKGDSDVIFRKLATYPNLSEEQRRQLARNLSLFQFDYVMRAMRSERFTLNDVRAVRKQVKDRLSEWGRSGTRYSRCIRKHPDGLRHALAWHAGAHPIGVSLMRAAIRIAAHRRAAANARRASAGRNKSALIIGN